LPNEAAEHIGCSYGKLMKMIRSGEIPHFRIGNRVFFMKEKLDAWLDEQIQKSCVLQNVKKKEDIKMGNLVEQKEKLQEYRDSHEVKNTETKHKPAKDITSEVLKESAKLFEESLKAIEEALTSINALSKVLNVSNKIDEGLILQLMYVPERYRAFADMIETNKANNIANEAMNEIMSVIKTYAEKVRK
jgi:excisionase family DNA binding protein